jgi:PAS domain S-box-containing protein
MTDILKADVESPRPIARDHARITADWYRALFHEMDEAYAVVEVLKDPAGRWCDFVFLEVNRAFTEHTSLAEPVGNRATQLLGYANPRWAALCGQVLDADAPLRIVDPEPTLGRTFDLFIFPLNRARNQVAVRFTDVTERVANDERLRQSEQRLRLIVENARDYAIFVMNPAGIVTDWLAGAEDVFGYAKDEIVGRDGDILFTPEDNLHGVPERERDLAARAGKAPNVRWHVRKDQKLVFIEGVNTALRDDRGNLIGFLKIGRDATERHEGHKRRQLLLAELQHRVRNILAMIRSIVRQSAEGHRDVDEFVAHLVGRLDAMSRTQVVLTRSAGAKIDFETLLRDEFAAQSVEDAKLQIDGPDVELSPKAAEVITLAIHELVTNSIKYGALSVVEGSLAITWRIFWLNDQRWLRLRWRETGEFEIDEAPARGFGVELIEDRVPYELTGTARLQIGPDAVEASIEFPLREGASVLETTIAEFRP